MAVLSYNCVEMRQTQSLRPLIKFMPGSSGNVDVDCVANVYIGRLQLWEQLTLTAGADRRWW